MYPFHLANHGMNKTTISRWEKKKKKKGSTYFPFRALIPPQSVLSIPIHELNPTISHLQPSPHHVALYYFLDLSQPDPYDSTIHILILPLRDSKPGPDGFLNIILIS